MICIYLSVGYLFILLMVSLAAQKFFSLLYICLFILIFCFCFWCQILKNSTRPMSRTLAPMFSSRGFKVSGFMFMSLIHFELIFVYGIRPWSIFILLYVAVQFYNTFYWGDRAFPIVYSCFLCHKLIDHLCVDLIPGSVLCSIDPGVCFYVSIRIF